MKKFTVRKIPLEQVKMILDQMYEEGVSLIDIECELVPQQDMITIIGREEQSFSFFSLEGYDSYIYLGP